MPPDNPSKQRPTNVSVGVDGSKAVAKLCPPMIIIPKVVIIHPMNSIPRFYILSVSKYINGQVIAYRIAGKPKMIPIAAGLYPNF